MPAAVSFVELSHPEQWFHGAHSRGDLCPQVPQLRRKAKGWQEKSESIQIMVLLLQVPHRPGLLRRRGHGSLKSFL